MLIFVGDEVAYFIRSVSGQVRNFGMELGEGMGSERLSVVNVVETLQTLPIEAFCRDEDDPKTPSPVADEIVAFTSTIQGLGY